jgi:hypothetical protein
VIGSNAPATLNDISDEADILYSPSAGSSSKTMKQILLIAVAGLTVAGLALLLSSELSQRRAAASGQLDYFHTCVKQEIAPAMCRSVVTFGDDLHRVQADVVDSVFSICKQRAIDSSHRPDEPTYVSGAVAAVFEQGQRITVETERKMKDHPDKFMEDQAVFAYSFCLEGNARGRSRTSNDPADVIEQSSFARCAENRQIVFDTYRGYAHSFSPEAMTALEQEFRRKLPGIIVKTREDMRQTAHP